ncbi:hypothetical protein T11_6969 [Trichinella zimbabwensis]|uniref:Reverse transcriptase RNase H-like domain-containing protein n=1 Tax=Trichinella zimbabwensis TaxID=268475 RepID=A0A0V1H8B3_9BILA|nr:hypothetical protein T11_6969 [Trichinella zimbabwensis]
MEEGGKERVVAYVSCSLTKPERRYCVKQREMLRLRFLVRTDHSRLRWLRESEGQVAQWLESLAELDFELELRQGRRTIIYRKFSYYLFKQIF